MPDDYSSLYQAAGNAFNVDPLLAQAVGQVESGGDPNAVSRDAQGNPVAHGLMQVTTPNLQRLNVIDPYKPEFNVPAGTRVLDEALTTANGNVPLALRIYQGGPDQSKWGPVNAAYPAKVAAAYQKLKASQPTGAASASGAPSMPTMTVRPGVPAQDDVDAFLTGKSAGAPSVAPNAPASAGGAGDDVAAFLTGGNAAQSAAPSEAAPGASDPLAGVSEYGYSDPGQAPASPAVSPIAVPIANVVNAAIQGYKDTSPILTPRAQQFVDQSGPIGRYVTNPLLHIAGAVPAAANALGSGVAQAITEGAQAAGQPALGRDLNMLAQVTPFARVGTGLPLSPAAAIDAPAETVSSHQAALNNMAAESAARRPNVAIPNPLATAASPAFVPPGAAVPLKQRLIDLIAEDDRVAQNKPAFVPPDSVQPPNPLSAAPRTVQAATVNPLSIAAPTVAEAPAAASSAPVPQSVGAASSRDTSHPSVIDMTPAQVQAYRSTAEGQKLLDVQQPGISDPNIYVPGVTPNQAEIEQSVNTSRELKALNVSAPEVSQEAKDIAAANNDARQRYFSSIAGSDVDVQNAIAARSAQAEQDLATAFGNKKPTDAQPVADTIKGILTNPRDSENTAVQQYIRPLLDRLTNADGSLKSDPEQLYGLREDVARMQSKAAKAETPTLDHVNGQLQQIKAALDGVIEQGAPGYQQYLDNFSTASRPIDTMQALQGFENKLYDAQNRMGYNKVQTMLRQIVDSRAAPGLNPYKSIPDETMQQLWNLRDDLRRSVGAQELARTPGSDTTQTMGDVLKGAGKVAPTWQRTVSSSRTSGRSGISSTMAPGMPSA